VRPEGVIDLDDLERVVRAGDVRLVALQAINQETGVVQPLRDVHALCMDQGIPLHVDAVQALGRTETPVLGTTRTVAAHKLCGPKGIGALVGSCGHKLHPVLVGGAQEKGLRPGTLDPMGAAGFLAALTQLRATREGFEAQGPRRDRLEEAVLAAFSGSFVNGARAHRLAHVSNVAIVGAKGAELVAALDVEGVGVSSGSACSAGTLEPSPVIAAMFDAARAACSVRITLGPGTTDAHIDHAVEAFRRVAARTRR
jgi:cysteine desulfurase